MKLKNNIYYLKKSYEVNETLEKRYMSINRSNEISSIINTSKKINSLLLQIKNESNTEVLENLYNTLIVLLNSKSGNKNQFSFFVNACDSTIKTIAKDKDKNNLKTIISLFFKYRTQNFDWNEDIIQSILDKDSQRKLSKIGQEKIIEIAKEIGYQKVKDIKDLFNYKFSITYYNSKIKNLISKELNFGAQNKELDIIVKSDNNLMFIEAKHIKEPGGTQNKQIKELIDIISIKILTIIFF